MNEEYGAIVINDSGLPDSEVLPAIRDQIPQVIAERYLEISSFNSTFGGGFSSRQATPAGLFVRSSYTRPQTIIEEMELAISLVDEDDDVGSTVGMIEKMLFQGWRHQHSDEQTVMLFDNIAKNLKLNAKFREITRTLATIGQCYPVKVFTRQQFNNFKPGQNPSVVAPNLIMLNPLSVRVASLNADGSPVLIQAVDDQTDAFLRAIGRGASTGTARSATQKVKQSDNPIAAALYIEEFIPPTGTVSSNDDALLSGLSKAWYLNPKMVTRYALSFNSSISSYAPIPLKRVFGLCEAKRLLNLMDYSLLQGGINFLIVVKKGSDNLPALSEEITNLQAIVQTSARTGVMVGDHRLNVEIITPNLEAMLSPERRNLLAKKITRAILCLPDTDFGRIEGGGTPEAEIISGNLTGDREIINDLIQQDIYDETVLRNQSTFTKGAPGLWFPPISIAGNHFFADNLLKLRDRGDIPRSWAVEFLGMSAEAAQAEREREVAAGFDEVMTSQNVPSTAAPGVNNGRPSTADGGSTGTNQNTPAAAPSSGGN